MSSPHSPPRTAAAGGEYYVRSYRCGCGLGDDCVPVRVLDTLESRVWTRVPRVDREGRAQVYCAVSSVKVRVLKSKAKKQRGGKCEK